MLYSDGFKARMVRRMSGSEAISANALSHEVGISQPTLSRWLRQVRTVPFMANGHDEIDQPKSTRQWTAQERRQLVAEAASLSDAELGAFLRGKGIHMAQLEQWRAEGDKIATAPAPVAKKKRTRKPTAEQRRIRELEQKLSRTEKRLKEAEALLALQKKIQEIWGDRDDDTTTRSET
jgi:transposase